MNKNILKQLDSFERQVDKTHNELNKTIGEFKRKMRAGLSVITMTANTIPTREDNTFFKKDFIFNF